MGIGRASGEGRAATAARRGDRQPAARGQHRRRTGRAVQHHRRRRTSACSRSTRRPRSSSETADPEANIIFGTVIDERMGDEISITVIATGFDSDAQARAPRSAGHDGDDRRFARLRARAVRGAHGDPRADRAIGRSRRWHRPAPRPPHCRRHRRSAACSRTARHVGRRTRSRTSTSRPSCAAIASAKERSTKPAHPPRSARP